MAKKLKQEKSSTNAPSIAKGNYKDDLHQLQIELVQLQRHFINCDSKILIILEGRDLAGKDGTIKRIVQHLSPRETRVVAQLGERPVRQKSGAVRHVLKTKAVEEVR